VTVAECNRRFITLLMMMMMMMTVGCHGDQYDQPASRMLVFRDLPDGVEPNHPQHLVIRTGYEVSFLSVTFAFAFVLLSDRVFFAQLCLLSVVCLSLMRVLWLNGTSCRKVV